MRVPVCDVNSDNFTQLWPSLLLAVRSASFVALDTELSGLGDRRALNAKSIDDRYKALCHISQTRSIVSLGLSTFKFLPPAEKIVDAKGGNSEVVSNWMVQTFNITVLCREEYVVEPEALVFLVDHGFDFNKQYSRGIPYSKGGNQDPSKPDEASIANLLSQLIVHRVPVVFHNAFVDLGFLYGNLYGPLPSSLGVFLADLSEMFQGGVYDTKYITEFVARYPASFLDYVFHRSLRGNAAEQWDCRVALTFPTYPDGCDFIGYRECSVSPRPALHAEVLQAMRGLVCSTFASYGWCPKRRQCPKSHDIDLILDTEGEEVKKKSRTRKRKRRRGNAGTCNPVDSGQTEERDNPDMDTAKDLHENTNSTWHVMKEDEIHSDDNLTLKNDSEVSTKPSENEINSIHSSDQCSSKSPRALNSCQRASDKTSHDGVCTDTSTRINKISKEPDAESSHMLTGETGDEKLNDSGSSTTNGSQSSHLSNSKGHRAGFDAFMTGFSMAAFAGKFATKPLKGPGLNDWGIEQLVNKVYLTGKDIPLLITKPNFSKNSKHHIEKQEQLKALQTSETT